MAQRIQRKRVKGWRMPPNTVYVGRPTQWGNPHDWRDWKDQAGTRLVDIELEDWCRDRATQAFREDIAEGAIKLDLAPLRGKNLACWCKRFAPCHADVLLQLVERLSPEWEREARRLEEGR